MTKELVREFAEVVSQLEEQLKFYREMGISDIGESAPGAKAAPVAGSKAQAALDASPIVTERDDRSPLQANEQPQIEEAIEKKKIDPSQTSLFGDIAADAGESPQRRFTLPCLRRKTLRLKRSAKTWAMRALQLTSTAQR